MPVLVKVWAMHHLSGGPLLTVIVCQQSGVDINCVEAQLLADIKPSLTN